MIKMQKFLTCVLFSLFLDINCSDETLIEAAKSGNSVEVESQLNQGANIEAHDLEGYTSLMHASREGRLHIVRLLLKRGAKPKMTYNYTEKSSHTALLCASTRLTPEHNEIARLLLENGADANQVNFCNNTALMQAAYKGNVSLVLMFLEHGAKVKMEDAYKRTALSYASNRAVAETLFRHGEDDINHVDCTGNTPLNQAVIDGNIELIRFFLENGANIDYIHSDEHTALGMAIYGKNIEIATLLLERGANPNIGYPPLSRAAYQGNKELVLLLLKYKASIDLQDAKKRTALIYAAAFGQEEVVEILLGRGADTTIRDKNNKTALDCARNDKIRQLLIDYDNSHKQNESDL